MATDDLPHSLPRCSVRVPLAVLSYPVRRHVSFHSAVPLHASVLVHIPGATYPPDGAAGRPGGTLPRYWRHTAVCMASPPWAGGSLPLYTIPRARIGAPGALWCRVR